MADFSQFLRKPAGEAKKPQALPIGDYPGVVKSFEFGDQNKNRTPYVRFHLGILDFAATVTEEEKAACGDLSKRQFRRDFYLTDDALWRLDEFLKSCGVPLSGRAYEEAIPEAAGAQVTVEVQQYVSDKNEVGNQVGKLFGGAGA